MNTILLILALILLLTLIVWMIIFFYFEGKMKGYSEALDDARVVTLDVFEDFAKKIMEGDNNESNRN